MTREQVLYISLGGAILGIAAYGVGDALHSTTIAWSGLALNIISTTALSVAVIVGLVDYMAGRPNGSSPTSRRQS